MTPPELLAVRGLSVRFDGAPRPVLDGLDLDLAAGECVAVVGPSGCGKSTLCRALLDLLPPGAERRGEVIWRGRELTGDPAAWRSLRGRELGLVLQDHRHAMDPVRTIGAQIAEVVALHRRDLDAEQRRREVLDLLDRVRLPSPLRLRYPHELSGGQRQRAGLAATLAAGPSLLLADEPTTALDLPVQRDIMALLAGLVRGDGLGLLLVTHDPDLVPLVADRVVTLSENAVGVTAAPPVQPQQRAEGVLEVRDVSVAVSSGRRRHDVVRQVSLEVPAGRTVGLAGESGSGKTTLLRAMAGWLTPRSGSIVVRDGAPHQGRARRQLVQLVSQDAAAALNPLQRAEDAVLEAARLVGDPATARRRTLDLMASVDLPPELARRRPHELSGGQRQRLGLARALAVEPRFLLADEPASSLDPLRRGTLLDLLARLQQERGLGLLLVSHDLGLLEAHCHEILVLADGVIVEGFAPAEHGTPRHPLSCDLAAAAPHRLTREILAGKVGNTSTVAGAETAEGCPYTARCDQVVPACRAVLPPLIRHPDGRLLRCPVCTPCSR